MYSSVGLVAVMLVTLRVKSLVLVLATQVLVLFLVLGAMSMTMALHFFQLRFRVNISQV